MTTSGAIATMGVLDPIKAHVKVVNVFASPAGPEMLAIVQSLTLRAFQPMTMQFVPVTANASVVPAGVTKVCFRVNTARNLKHSLIIRLRCLCLQLCLLSFLASYLVALVL